MQTKTRENVFIRLKPIIEIVEAAIWTGRIEGETPVSILLVAPQESAKSAVLCYFRETPTIKYYQDVTAKPLSLLRSKIERQEVRHICLLDLIPVASHSKGASQRVFAVLGALMEEGQAAVADAGGETEWKNLPKCGILSAITPEAYADQRRQWHKSGFATRIIKVGFQYRNDTVHAIHSAIRNSHRMPDPINLKLPDKPVRVKLTKAIMTATENLCREWAVTERVYGFRFHRRLRALIKARALIQGRRTAAKQDFEFVKNWMPFFTTDPLTPI